MNAAPESFEGERLELLVTLAEAYERQHFPLDLPNPVEGGHRNDE
jgi:HTH-type transcriptional regulator/antitoxin HigA